MIKKLNEKIIENNKENKINYSSPILFNKNILNNNIEDTHNRDIALKYNNYILENNQRVKGDNYIILERRTTYPSIKVEFTELA